MKMFLCAALLLNAAGLFAHGVEAACVSGRTPRAVQTVRFGYSTGEPMMYAKVTLYPPSRPDTEVLQSVADEAGYFSFVPSENGSWRLTAEDGMGHRGEITVLVDDGTGDEDDSARADSDRERLPVPVSAAIGVSVILNIFLLWYFAGMKKTAGKRAFKEARDAH